MKVRKWDTWQSYRSDRSQPPWIKVHRCLMRNPDWVSLSDAQRGHLVCMWMLAADNGGKLPDDPKLIQRLCYLEKEPDIKTFVDHGFLEDWRQPDAKVTPTRRQPDANMTHQTRLDKTRLDKTRREEKGETAKAAGTSPAISETAKPLTDLQKVMTVYKIVCGYEKEDKTWDRTFFPRYARAASALLEFMGNWKDAADCIQDTFEKIKKWNPEANISIDTILNKHAAEWKKDKCEREEKHHGVFPGSSNGSLPVNGSAAVHAAGTREKPLAQGDKVPLPA